jgi:polar amino acid transport system substrate-binding protein
MAHDLPPYSYLNEQQNPAGLAIKPVTCAFTAMQQAYVIDFFPWSRAQFLVKQDKADAFFAASYSAEREQYAKLSDQIAPQQWHWYLLKDNPKNPKSPQFKRTATVGGFSGGNMTDWLHNNNYRVMANPSNNSQLLRFC